MVHLVISAEAWAALPGNRIPDGFGGFTVAPVPAPPVPGQLASNASHATIYLHREAADLHRRYLGYVAVLRAALLDSLGTDIQVMLRDPTHDMVILSIPQIMVVLSDSYGTASAADVQALLSQLSTPIPGGDHDTFVSFTVAFRQIIAALERAGQPLSQYLQCRHLRMATASQPTIARAVTLYFEKAPLLADQCLTDLIAFVRLQLQNAVSTSPVSTCFSGIDADTPSICRSPASNIINAWADSGASSILIAHNDAHNIPHVRPHDGHSVQVATGDVVTSVGSATVSPSPGLNLPVHVFPPNTLAHSLCGIAPFTREGCVVTFTDRSVCVEKDGQVLLQGSKNPGDTLWSLPLTFSNKPPKSTSSRSPHHAHLAISNQTNAEYVRFSHATFGSPPVSTFMRATSKGYLGNWPRLTTRMIRKNQPNAVATHVGHLDRNRQGQRSTQRQELSSLPVDLNDELSPPPDEWASKAYIKLVTLDHTNHSDATGRFPVTSLRGNQYILVSVFNNYVHLEPMPSRSAAAYLKAYKPRSISSASKAIASRFSVWTMRLRPNWKNTSELKTLSFAMI